MRISAQMKARYDELMRHHKVRDLDQWERNELFKMQSEILALSRSTGITAAALLEHHVEAVR